jgi:hypothetical protein
MYVLILWTGSMNSLIFNTLILTLNDDILVILNDLILTSTILVNLVITRFIMSLQDRGQLLNICLFRSISELIRMPRKHWWNFDLHQRIFLFLTDLLGYMVIQIIYKQIIYMQDFTVLSNFVSQNRPLQLVLTTYIWDGATLCDTKSGNHSTIWTGLCR